MFSLDLVDFQCLLLWINCVLQALLGNLKFRETKPDESEVDPSTQKWLEVGFEQVVYKLAIVTMELGRSCEFWS